MSSTSKIHAPVFAALLCTSVADAVPLNIELPQETASYAPGPGSEIAKGQCLICHSAEYVSTQPPTSPRAYWQATVEKMQKKFSAPLPDEQVAPLVDYLVKTYGNEQPQAGK